jgi:hypothetical protein
MLPHWYKKPYVKRSQRICEKCSSNQTEDELHFIIKCPLYIDNRKIMFNNMIYSSENRPLSILSILNQYFNIDKTTEKYRGAKFRQYS